MTTTGATSLALSLAASPAFFEAPLGKEQTKTNPSAEDGALHADFERSRHCLGIVGTPPASSPPIKFKLSESGGKTIVEQDHPSQAVSTAVLMHSLGSMNGHFTECLISQLANVVTTGTTLNPADLNNAVAMVQGIRPADETEAMLAAQMVAIHNATMTAARRLKNVDMIKQQDSASNMLNKLARTFATQVEALKKYRSAGEQTIKVQHVTVNEGGQAIVGNVRTGGGGTSETGGQPHEPCQVDELSPALLSNVQALAAGVPSPSGKWLDRVPVSRRTRRGTQGQD